MLLPKSDYAWKKARSDINEAPAVLHRIGRVFMTRCPRCLTIVKFMHWRRTSRRRMSHYRIA